MGGEHQVEVPRLGEAVLRPTGRACTLEVDLVGTEAALALLAVNHRVTEVRDVTAGLPNPGMHKNGSIQTYDVVMDLGHLLPPEIADVVLQLYTQWTVVIRAVQAAVDFARLENESTSFAQRDNLVHRYFCHLSYLSLQ